MGGERLHSPIRRPAPRLGLVRRSPRTQTPDADRAYRFYGRLGALRPIHIGAHAKPVARAKGYAFWGAFLGGAITTGPIIGGLITTFFGWRWVFLINLPVCAMLVFATLRAIQESRDHEAKGLDLAGIVTFTSGLFFLIWALIDANALGWTTMAILG